MQASILQACQSIYPLKDVFIRKVKTLKAPKFDITKLMEVRTIRHPFPPCLHTCPMHGAACYFLLLSQHACSSERKASHIFGWRALLQHQMP
jgi:hypothetical protein